MTSSSSHQRRRFIAGAGAGLAGGLALSACGGSAAGNSPAPVVILVHGSGHSSFCWVRVLPSLVMGGVVPLAVDLPGTGLSGRFPASRSARPFDPAAFASEPSPSAVITLADYANHVIDLVDRLTAARSGPIYLVGHSLGGLTLNSVAEARADRLAGLVYLSAIMPAANQSLLDTLNYPEAAQSYVLQGKSGSVGEPTIGASRMDIDSPDPAYRSVLKAAYCDDATDADFMAWTNLLVPDDPDAPLAAPIALTTARFGRLPRTYVRFSRDRIIPPAWASRMVAAVDAFTPGNRTRVLDVDSSHSAFLSRPSDLAQAILAGVTR